MNIIELIFIKHRFLCALLIRFFFAFFESNNSLSHDTLTQAAKMHLDGNSPFLVENFNSSPLLAYLAVPNITVDSRFSKFLFSAVDIAAGAAIEVLLVVQNYRRMPALNGFFNSKYRQVSIFYLYNPFGIVIAARGSSDCLVVFLLLTCLILIECQMFVPAAVSYGFALHLRIYPVVFFLALYFYIIKITMNIDKDRSQTNFFARICGDMITKLQYVANVFLNVQAIAFVLVSIATFGLLLLYFYWEYGNSFLYEYMFKHLTEGNPGLNHNVYFYTVYLTYYTSVSSIASLMAFLPQAVLIFISSFLLFTDINLCLLVIVKIFVNFNKLSSFQHKLWYMSMIPMIVPLHKMLFDRRNRAVKLVLVLVCIEFLVCYLSIDLEQDNSNKAYEMWLVTSLLFFLDCLCVKYIVRHYGYSAKLKLYFYPGIRLFRPCYIVVLF